MRCEQHRTRTPAHVESGVPNWRTRVLYLPQHASALAATPRDFLTMIANFKARAVGFKGSKTRMLAVQTATDGPIPIAQSWGIDESLWDREWSGLSGGEVQRIALAIAVGIGGAEVLLLDGEEIPTTRLC